VLGLGLLNFHSVLPSSHSMAKGSQLSQLKSALSQAGATKSQSGSKRKRSKNEDVDKERRAAKLREIQQKMNPFDVQVTKTKHDTGGRKIKGAVGRPAQSKQAGIQQVRRRSSFLSSLVKQTRMSNSVQKPYSKNTKIRIALAGYWIAVLAKMTPP
jgi:nucleolar protein 14